nr:hypothetical protein [Tanacetum cinerariifolium]
MVGLPTWHFKEVVEKGETDAKEDDNKQPKPKDPKQSTNANIEFIGKRIATEEQSDPQPKLVKATAVVRKDHDEPIRVPYMINGKMYLLTSDEINVHMEKEEKLRKAEEEAKLFEMSKPEMMKVVSEEAKKIGIPTKLAISVT